MSESRKRAIKDGWTDYSAEFEGESSNHYLVSRFDVAASGHLGISQRDGATWTDRVLLSPAQVRELLKFLKAKRSWESR